MSSSTVASVKNRLPNYIVIGGQVLAKWLDSLRYEAQILKINHTARTAFVTWTGWANSWDTDVGFDDLEPLDEDIAEQCYLERLSVEVENLEEEREQNDRSFRTSSSLPIDGKSPKLTRNYKKRVQASVVSLCDVFGDGIMYTVKCLDRHLNNNPSAVREIIDLIRTICELVPEVANQLLGNLAANKFDIENCEGESAERLCFLASAYNDVVLDFLQNVSDERLVALKNKEITQKAALRTVKNAVFRCLPRTIGHPLSLETISGIDVHQLQILIEALRPTEADLFVHLGSGTGELIFYMSAVCQLSHSVGFELRKISDVANKSHDEFIRLMNWQGKVASPLSLANGNYLDSDYCAFICEEATIVYMDTKELSPVLTELSKKNIFRQMRNGSRIVSTTRLSNDATITVNHKNFEDLSAVITTTELVTPEGSKADCTKLYINTIDRVKLETFLKENVALAAQNTRKRMSLDLRKTPEEQQKLIKKSSEI